MLISICMATYNGGKYIHEQMESILHQEFKENPDVEMEIIVSDDGSTDNTLDIISEFNDLRIKVVRHTEHRDYKYYRTLRFATDNFANALSYANGEYIFFSDQDDIWYPWKVDRAISNLRKFGGVLCSAFYETYSMGGPPHKLQKQHKYDSHIPYFSKKVISIFGFSMGFARPELRYIMPMPRFITGHDMFIGYSAQLRHKLHFLNEPCAIHRRLAGSASALKKDHDPLWVKILIRLNLYRLSIWRWITIR